MDKGSEEGRSGRWAWRKPGVIRYRPEGPSLDETEATQTQPQKESKRERGSRAPADALRVEPGPWSSARRRPGQAMQDEDGYISLKLKPLSAASASVDPAPSSWWRMMALILLTLSLGMVVGLTALGIMGVTQRHYLQAENDNLSQTLKQLAKKFCQDLIKQLEENKKTITNHKCSPCDTQWRYYGDSCYGFFKRNLTWQESRQYCADLQATMVRMTSQSTMDYIRSRTSFTRWTGLSRQNPEKVWRWEDGTVVPNNMMNLSGDGKENMNCAYFHNGKILPALCTARYFFMCERKAGAANVNQLL
ncbi:C-type lectin domain family 1 member B-like [Ctenodactylus gundi]